MQTVKLTYAEKNCKGLWTGVFSTRREPRVEKKLLEENAYLVNVTFTQPSNHNEAAIYKMGVK